VSGAPEPIARREASCEHHGHERRVVGSGIDAWERHLRRTCATRLGAGLWVDPKAIHLQGLIDEAQVYNGASSATEIQSIMTTSFA